MNKAELQSEIARLRAQQDNAKQDEIFSGLSSEERAAYDARAERIRELDVKLDEISIAEQASAAQRHEWNKLAETDSPQEGQRQPYRDRERDSIRAFTTLRQTRRLKPSADPRRRN